MMTEEKKGGEDGCKLLTLFHTPLAPLGTDPGVPIREASSFQR